MREGPGEDGRRLRSLIDSLPDGVAEVSEDGSITFASRRFSEMFGYAAGELCGTLLEDLVPGPGLRGRRKDGGTFPVAVVRSAPEAGRVIAVVRDETESRHIEESLRLREAAMAAAASAVVITDAEGIIQWVNPAFTAVTGYASVEVLGKSTRMLKSGAHPPEFYRELWTTIKEGLVWKGAMVNRRRDGALYHEEMTVAPVRGPGGALTHFVAIKHDDTPRWRAEESLRKLNRAYRALCECNQALVRAGDEGSWVRRMCRIITEFGGYRAAWVAYGALGRLVLEAWDGPAGWQPSAPILEEAVGALGVESVTRAQRGHGSTALLPLACEGEVIGVLGIHTDESDAFDAAEMRLIRELAGDMAYGIASLRARAARERAMEELRRSEEQLRHAQKMEAAGRLAGGVAHDFNNLLTVILGVCEEACSALPQGDARREDMETALLAARKGADLTSQLLAFCRRQVVVKETFDFGAVVKEMRNILARLLGDDVALSIAVDSEPVWVHAGRGNMEQVVLNLAVNARDAMPRGGRLSIRVHAADVAEPRPCLDGHLPPGRYALLIVEDDGCGMSEEVRARVFEPFFTTKAAGKGTGLGLATVYGTVRQAGGGVSVRSVPGKGSAFELFLPRADRPAPPHETPTLSSLPRAEGTVLLVEDDPPVRALARGVLEAAGFSVLAAASPAEALALCAASEAAPRLIVTDVVLPGISGPGLVSRVREGHPGVKALYMSGYSEHSILENSAEELSRCFLQKPFTPAQLVRRALESLAEPPKGPV